MAADADLALVYRIDVTTSTGFETGLSLPTDLAALEENIANVDAVLVLLDPMMSRLDGHLDTHKDAEVRRALEPLTRIADRTGTSILGLIHCNKSTSTDPLTMLMASRAFAAVARAVLFCMVDPEDESSRIIGQPKNNLGRTDLPTLSFQIVSAHVADTDEGPICHWPGHLDRRVHAQPHRPAGDRLGGVHGAHRHPGGSGLVDRLVDRPWRHRRVQEHQAGGRAGRASRRGPPACPRQALLEVTSEGFPRMTYWTLPGTAPVVSSSRQSSHP